jgi:hypothetical protein
MVTVVVEVLVFLGETIGLSDGTGSKVDSADEFVLWGRVSSFSRVGTSVLHGRVHKCWDVDNGVH